MAQLTKTQFQIQTDALFPTNGVGAISAADVREHFGNMVDSVPFSNVGPVLPPGVTDDSANTGGNGAFEIGDMWVDEFANVAYICLDNSVGAAIWYAITTLGGISISVTGTPVNNQLTVWTGGDSVEGDANLLWDGTLLTVTGNIAVSGTVDGRDVAADGSKLDGIASGAEVNIDKTINAQTGITYALQNTDLVGNVVITCANAGAITFEVPAGLTGTEPVVIIANDAGEVTFNPTGGVVLRSFSNRYTIDGQFSSAALIPNGANVYQLIGRLKV